LVRHGRDDALSLVRGVERVIAARGHNVVQFDKNKNPPDEATLLHHLLGTSGNLRAPTMRSGKTLLVAGNEIVIAESEKLIALNCWLPSALTLLRRAATVPVLAY
jgi:hypothetical protein